MINIAKPLLGKEEQDAVKKVLESGMIASGPKTVEFEKRFADMSKQIFKRRFLFSLFILWVGVFIASCGSGGEGIVNNSKPLASAATDQNVITHSQVTLDGSGSRDADDDLLNYTWSFTSKPAGSKAVLSDSTVVNPSFMADVDGVYVLSLVVNDGSASSGADTVVVNAATANSAPTANAGSDQSVVTGSQVSLDGSGSSDADGDSLTYCWFFTTKPLNSKAVLSDSTAVTPSFTADIDGTYVLCLVVNDGSLESGADTVVVNAAVISHTEWAFVSAGYFHTLGLKIDGSLYAWGDNDSGRLGDGTTADKITPIQIESDTDWTSVFGGGGHTVGLKVDGSLYAWGQNTYGQLGDGTAVNKHTPTQIGSDSDWASVSAGYLHTVGIKSDGSLYAWGNNDDGELGDGTIADKSIPTQIGSDRDWASVSAGYYYTVAIKIDGSLYAWGKNDDGELGDGTASDKFIPTQIGSDTDWASVFAGYYYTVAIKDDGSLYAWGNNDFGQLGDGTTVGKDTPTQIGLDRDWASVSCGVYHTVGLTSDGSFYVWGSDFDGQLGDSTTAVKFTPTQIGSDTEWVSVSAGVLYTAAIKVDGSLYAWGRNDCGQLVAQP